MNNLNKFLNYAIGAVVVVIVIGGVYFKRDKIFPKSAEAKKIELTSSDLDDIVNRNLTETSRKKIHDRFVADKALEDSKRAINEIVKANQAKMENEQRKLPVGKQIHREAPQEIPNSPSEAINSQVYERNTQNKMDELDRKEYIRQYKENALRGGFIVELGPDLEVIRATPVRQPSQQDDSSDSYPSD